MSSAVGADNPLTSGVSENPAGTDARSWRGSSCSTTDRKDRTLFTFHLHRKLLEAASTTWHGRLAHGLAVLRKRRPYSVDISKSAAFFAVAVRNTAQHGRAAHATNIAAPASKIGAIVNERS